MAILSSSSFSMLKKLSQRHQLATVTTALEAPRRRAISNFGHRPFLRGLRGGLTYESRNEEQHTPSSSGPLPCHPGRGGVHHHHGRHLARGSCPSAHMAAARVVFHGIDPDLLLRCRPVCERDSTGQAPAMGGLWCDPRIRGCSEHFPSAWRICPLPWCLQSSRFPPS